LDLAVPPQGDIVPYRSTRARSDRTALLGMIFFLGSWAMMFASLFFAYGLVRSRAAVWPPGDLPALPLFLPGIATLVIALSSAAMQLAVHAVRDRREGRAGPLLVLTLLLGAGFVGLQAILWSGLYAAGLRPQEGPYASVFWGLTGIHAAHVGVGLLALAWLAFRTFRGAFTAARFAPLRLWAMYWHFVGIVWLIVYLIVFVL
jgi:cytochrome c oxidase subunit III